MDLASGAPRDFKEILLLPGLLAFFAVFTRMLLFASERNTGKKAKGRWFAYVLDLIGLHLGARMIWALHNPSTGSIYRQTIYTKKVLWSHYLAFFLPLAVLIFLFIWDRVGHRRIEERSAYDM